MTAITISLESAVERPVGCVEFCGWRRGVIACYCDDSQRGQTQRATCDTGRSDSLNMSIRLIITLKAKKSRLAALTEIMMQTGTELPETEGCQNVCIFKNTNNPCAFSLIKT